MLMTEVNRRTAMAALEQLESKLDEMLVKKAPFQIPENGRKWIAEYAWIFALVGLVLGVFAFFPLLAVVGLVSTLGVAVGAGFAVLLAWVSLAVLAAYLVVLGISIPKLKRQERGGWELTYYSTLVFFAYDVINWLASPAVNFFGFVLNTVGVVAGLYILFQVRSYFKGAKLVAKATSK
jgi:hypothetical protein